MDFSSSQSFRKCSAYMAMLLFCLFTVQIANAQEKVIPNEKVKAAMDSAEIENLMTYNPDGLLFYNYLTEGAWYLTNLTEEKAENIESYPYLQKKNRKTKEVLSEVLDVKDLPTFNLLEYQYKITKAPGYYRIQNSDQILVIKSHQEIIESINKNKK